MQRQERLPQDEGSDLPRMRGAELSRGGVQGQWQQQRRREDIGLCPTPANQKNPIWLFGEGLGQRERGWGMQLHTSYHSHFCLQHCHSWMTTQQLWARMSFVHTKLHSTSVLAFTDGKYQYSCASVFSYYKH